MFKDYRPFINLRRFDLRRKIMDDYDKGRLSEFSSDVPERLGNFFLDFAMSSYFVAAVLRTDPIYLAFGKESRYGRLYQVKLPESAEKGVPYIDEMYFVDELRKHIDPSEIAKRIKGARKFSGNNSRDTAKEIHVSLATYLGYENPDTKNPDALQRFSFPVFYKLPVFFRDEKRRSRCVSFSYTLAYLSSSFISNIKIMTAMGLTVPIQRRPITIQPPALLHQSSQNRLYRCAFGCFESR